MPVVPEAYSALFDYDLFLSAHSSVVSSVNYDFGVIHLPFGARVFVVQTAICVTKTHLANIKK